MGNIRILFQKYNRWIAGLLLIISFSMMILCSRKQVESIKKDIGITSARIVKVESAYRGGPDFTYEFKVNNIEYKNSTVKLAFSLGEGYDLLNFNFPVIYQKSNPDNCQLLITPYEFKEYNIPYPDSLNWVREKYFKGQ